MYQVDEKDKVHPLDAVPLSSAGAPLPLVLADEHRVVLSYYLEDRTEPWDGTKVRMIDPANTDGPVAMIRFQRCSSFMHGMPNDEAFSGHPLASRGLQPYSAFRIENSSWIRRLERMNSVHHRHKPENFWKLQHFIFAFHDSVFECVCRDFDIHLTRGPILKTIPQMLTLLQSESTPPA